MTDKHEPRNFPPGGPHDGAPPPGPPRLPQFNFNPAGHGRGLIVGIAVGVMALVLGTIIVTGRGGIVEIADDEVAVIVNYISGESELVVAPGYRMFMPFFSQAFLFDKSPNKFVMEGDRDRDYNHVSKLTVRAKDGSNFWFETMEIQFQLIVSKAPFLLHDSGPGDAFKQHWVRTFARSVLRDEFGRFSAEEVADPTTYSQATQSATDKLNAILEPHGVRIVQIITPKPKFDQAYEQAIEDRKVANQEVERLKIEAVQLVRERERRLANIERDKATEYEQLLGEVEAERLMALRDQVEVEKSADAWLITMSGEGEAMKQEMLQQARAQEEQARMEAEGLHAKVEALALRGDILVREALVRKFSQIRFNIVPYQRDPSPVRIEHLSAVPAVGGPR